MPISVTCSECGKRIKAPDEAAGRKGRCPGCGAMLVISASETAPAAVPKVEAEAEPDPVAPGRVKAPGKKARPRQKSGLGIAALVLGILSALVCWIPFLGLAAAWLLGGLGALLGTIAIILAVMDSEKGYIAATAGTALAVVSILAGSIISYQFARQIGDDLQMGPEGLAMAPMNEGPMGAGPGPAEIDLGGPEAPRDETSVTGLDRNGDGRLSADEVPERLKDRFGALDVSDDGYLDELEWSAVTAESGNADVPRGEVIADTVIVSADDFVVDIYHNGERVPLWDRKMIAENWGSTAEEVTVEVREGDWLVFSVANNRLRWDGAYYFGVAGLKEDGSVAIESGLGNGQWSYCEEPGQVPRFVENRGYLSDQAVLAVDRPYAASEGAILKRVPGWSGTPVWGPSDRRIMWVKYLAPAPGAASASGALAVPGDDGDLGE